MKKTNGEVYICNIQNGKYVSSPNSGEPFIWHGVGSIQTSPSHYVETLCGHVYTLDKCQELITIDMLVQDSICVKCHNYLMNFWRKISIIKKEIVARNIIFPRESAYMAICSNCGLITPIDTPDNAPKNVNCACGAKLDTPMMGSDLNEKD
jgi:hypothetical protein